MKKFFINYGWLIYLIGIMMCPYIKTLDYFYTFWIVIAPVIVLEELSKEWG